MVGIDSDSRVRELKGSSRPINNQYDRAEVLLSLKGVDSVYIYNTAEELNETVRVLSPHIMVIGDDYKDKTVIGSQHAGSVQFFPKISGYSTTQMLCKIAE